MATNPYYVVTGAPVTQSRGVSATIRSEYSLINTGFDAVYTAMLLRGLKGGETWTGVHAFTGATATFATQAALDSSTKAATTAYADSAVSASAVTLNASIALKADIASPTFTGTPAAPTAAAGTATTQIATCSFVMSAAFSSALPGQTDNSGKFVTTDGSAASWADVLPTQTSNSGKFLTTNGTAASWADVLPTQTSNSGKFLTTNGTAASWAYSNVASVTTATTATTLTSTPTLLKITPASYGVAVTLPDATGCSVGGPLHIIDNKGAYPVRVLNSAGTLLGFIFAGVVSHISLIDKSTAAGVWTVENSELVGASAQLLTTNIGTVFSVIDLGSSRELIFGMSASTSYYYAVVYDKAANTFGAVTLVRTLSPSGSNLGSAVLSATNQVLCVTCSSAAAAFEAVTLSISGTTITVNTAATATLSANISAFADGCGLIAVGSSFVTSYTVATPAAQIRALSISGTTVTIGAATVLQGTVGGLIVAADSTHIIAASYTSGIDYCDPYTISGSTITIGTGGVTTSYGGAIGSTIKLFALGTRFVFLIQGSASTVGRLMSLTGAALNCSTSASLGTATIADAIVVGTNKVLVLGTGTTNNANILTDTAGTASAGTAITLNAQASRACLYASGTDAYVADTGSGYRVQKVDCSGASPVLISTCLTRGENNIGSMASVSNSVLSKSADLVTSNLISQKIAGVTGAAFNSVIRATGASIAIRPPLPFSAGTGYRGKADSERWVTDASTVITKVECAA